MLATEKLPPRPWYREPWPWILMGLPASAIIAGFITLGLAITSYDGLVADDYYKQGLAINKRIAGEQLALGMGLEGSLVVTTGRAELKLIAREGVQLPVRLQLSIISPVRAGADMRVLLERAGAGYAGDMPPLKAGHWNLVLEDPDKTWRLKAQASLPAETPVTLKATMQAN